MSIQLSRSRRALTITGLATAVILGGAGAAYAATSSGSSSTPATHSGAATTAKKHPRPEDLVTAVSGTSLTVDTPTGSKTFTLTSSTKYHSGRTAASAQDVKVGEMVRVATGKAGKASGGSPVARSVTVVTARVTGYVQAISGSALTIVDEHGFTRTVRTSGSTSYRKNGATGSFSDVTVGSLVHAQGTVEGDGTTLDATAVRVGHA